jgi:hypothetical protein
MASRYGNLRKKNPCILWTLKYKQTNNTKGGWQFVAQRETEISYCDVASCFHIDMHCNKNSTVEPIALSSRYFITVITRIRQIPAAVQQISVWLEWGDSASLVVMFCTGPSSETLEGVRKLWLGGGTGKGMYVLFTMKVLNKSAFALFAIYTCWFPLVFVSYYQTRI